MTNPKDTPGPGQILWAAPAFDADSLPAGTRLSLAANRWNLGLLGGLAGLGIKPHVVSLLRLDAFPKGPLWVRPPGVPLHKGIEGEMLAGWCNWGALRERTMGMAYRRAFKRLLARGPVSAVVTYNTPPSLVALGQLARDRGVPWITIEADGVGDPQRWEAYDRTACLADAAVFLSHSLFEQSRSRRKLHLDGGVISASPPSPPPQSRMVLFSGKLSGHAGLGSLLRAVPLVQTPGARFVVCGFGKPSEPDLLRTTPGLEFLGQVPQSRLDELYLEAGVFVNPRPTSDAQSAGNFPSKVMEYLAYAKPVVSTWTSGLAPGYRDVLCVSESDSPQALASAIDRALALSPADALALRQRQLDFLAGHTWLNQARRLADFIAETRP